MSIQFYLNGEPRCVSADPCASLASYLTGAGLSGTKTGCNEGGCGACTVLMTRWDDAAQTTRSRAVLGCLTPLGACHRTSITTVEGLGTPEAIHPVQERIAKFHGTQCGYCTPGIVMSLYAFFLNHPDAKVDDIGHALDANLCRCTGYRPIADAAKSFAADYEDWLSENAEKAAQSEPCARGITPRARFASAHEQPFALPTPFPAEYCCPEETLRMRAVGMDGRELDFARPATLAELTTIVREMVGEDGDWAKVKYLGGCSEVSLERNVDGKAPGTAVVALNALTELRAISLSADGSEVTIGGATTLTEIQEFYKANKHAMQPHVRTAMAILDRQLNIFANSNVRATATLAGNVINASPIADMPPILAAVGATITLTDLQNGEQRDVPAREFWLGFRRIAARTGRDLLHHVTIGGHAADGCVYGGRAYKVTRRLEDDIAYASGCAYLAIDAAGLRDGHVDVVDAGFALGGMSTHPLYCPEVSEVLHGRLTQASIDRAIDILGERVRLDPTTRRSAEYRLTAAAGTLVRAVAQAVAQAADAAGADPTTAVAAVLGDASENEARELAAGDDVGARRQAARTYSWQAWGDDLALNPVYEPPAPDGVVAVHRSMPIVSAALQCCGQAEYASTMRLRHDCLHGAVISTGVPHALVNTIHTDRILKAAGAGAVRVVTAKDCPKNSIRGCGVAARDELVIVAEGEESPYFGAPVALLLADSQEHAVAGAERVARAINTARRAGKPEDAPIEFTELPAVVTKTQAQKLGTEGLLLGQGRHIQTGWFKEQEGANPFDECEHVIEGVFRTPAQEHFYLETQSCVSEMGENGEISVISSTQHLDAVGGMVSNMLCTPRNKVYVETRRLGGGFGGKEGNLVHTGLSALGAYATKRQVSVVLPRHTDMRNTGKRHPMEIEYKMGTKDGRIYAFSATIHSISGHALDLSMSVLERAVLHLDNVYDIPHCDFHGYPYKTNTPSNTAFRGFGAPQAILACEFIVNEMARKAGIDQIKLRDNSMYQDGSAAPFGQKLANVDYLHRAWQGALERADIEKRRRQVAAYNRDHVTSKRGLGVMPMRFGVAFTQAMLNQACATVNIYKDGSVLIAAHVVEMGQGAYSKIIQLVADELHVPVDTVYIRRTTTEALANASPTSATTAADLHGAAAALAAHDLAIRLEPYRTPDRTFAQACLAAWLDRVCLVETAFYKTPMSGYNFATGVGQPFAYFAYGAGVAEVEIDLLSGASRIIRADIEYDAGESLNPAIDIGQVEGAFVQGTGWLTTEEVGYQNKFRDGMLRPTGQVLATGPGNYKIPGLADIPEDFRVRLLGHAPNEAAVRLSKGVGEPPFCLGTCVGLAIDDAVRNAGGNMTRLPWTPENVKMSCAPDRITRRLFPEGARAMGDYTEF